MNYTCIMFGFLCLRNTCIVYASSVHSISHDLMLLGRTQCLRDISIRGEATGYGAKLCKCCETYHSSFSVWNVGDVTGFVEVARKTDAIFRGPFFACATCDVCAFQSTHRFLLSRTMKMNWAILGAILGVDVACCVSVVSFAVEFVLSSVAILAQVFGPGLLLAPFQPVSVHGVMGCAKENRRG